MKSLCKTCSEQRISRDDADFCSWKCYLVSIKVPDRPSCIQCQEKPARDRGKFCSRECYDIYRKPIERYCEHCQMQLFRWQKNFCSVKCRQTHAAKLCEYCKKNPVKLKKNRFCSSECFSAYRLYAVKLCEYCKKNPVKLKKNRFCSKECFYASRPLDIEARRIQHHLATRRYQTAKRERVNEIKMSKGCVDCGYKGHPAALDFDHRPGEIKLLTIGSKLYNVGWDRILDEINKCDIRCANCHRIRTFERDKPWTRGRNTVHPPIEIRTS